MADISDVNASVIKNLYQLLESLSCKSPMYLVPRIVVGLTATSPHYDESAVLNPNSGHGVQLILPPFCFLFVFSPEFGKIFNTRTKGSSCLAIVRFLRREGGEHYRSYWLSGRPYSTTCSIFPNKENLNISGPNTLFLNLRLYF